MSATLTRSNRKPQYKDYVIFLESYKNSNNKKEEQFSLISNDSGVSNSSSLSSIVAYNDSTDSAANNLTKPTVIMKSAKDHNKAATVKTELFIEIKSPSATEKFQPKFFEARNIKNTSDSSPPLLEATTPVSVSDTAKIFEKNTGKNGTLKPSNSFTKKTSSIEEISKKFENTSQHQQKAICRRAASIGPVPKKTLENAKDKPRNFNSVPKPFQMHYVKPEITLPKPSSSVVNKTFPKQGIPDTYSDSPDSALSSLSISPSPSSPSITPPPQIRGLSSPTPLLPINNIGIKPIGPLTSLPSPLSPPPPPPPPLLSYSCSETVGTVSTNPSLPPPPPLPLPPQLGANIPNNKFATPIGVIDKNDPRVKRAVYGALRNMYGSYHDQANDYLATLPKNRVKKNNGLDSIINSIAQTQFYSNSHSNNTPFSIAFEHLTNCPIEFKMDPPACVQNAMMTKDKKPFTYTPGGIDLSEVRSPRMQRRIERNANLGGAAEYNTAPLPPQNTGPLPPSVLAAMRPQTQVQVFPNPPPPPPMQKNVPPPPPPPTCPLPTQKVTTGDNQVLERPDMTKIIPENPMALLRKTGGPSPRKSIVDQMFEEQNCSPTSPPQKSYEPQSPKYQPSDIERPSHPSSVIQSPQRQPQSGAPPRQQYQSPAQSPPQPQYQPEPSFHQQQLKSFDSPTEQSYNPPVIQRQATLPRHEPLQGNAVSSNVGSLYIPPLNQQQKPVYSPPTPPDRQPQMQSPGTPTLKEAPRPWQQKNVQQQEVPPWARKDEEERVQQTRSPPNMQQRWQQPANVTPAQQHQSPQQFQQRTPAFQQQKTAPNQNQFFTPNSAPYQQEKPVEDKNPNAVYITQPVVLQHPGSRFPPQNQGQPQQQQQRQPYQQQQTQKYQPPTQNSSSHQPALQTNPNIYQQKQQQPPKAEGNGVRIIPIQIEVRSVSSPGSNERNFNRQTSWGTQPTQSNSFKVIQKFTNTDDDDNDDTPVTHHSPRYPQEMTEQVRRMKLNDNGQHKQVGNGHCQPYVHPSEQTVPEPKKYMGSNIPSRSFKMLQAMTAPSESCANANYVEEKPINPSPYNPYAYYPMPPYWSELYHPLPDHNESSQSFARIPPKRVPTPVMPPCWPDYYNFHPHHQTESCPKLSDKGGRSTPLPIVTPMVPSPYWTAFISPNVPGNTHHSTEKCLPQSKNTTIAGSSENEYYEYSPYLMYPPSYYDPYYYSYYYGYHPMIPRYCSFPESNNTEERSEEYCGEISNHSSRRSSLKRRNSVEDIPNSVQSLRTHFEVRSKSAAPRMSNICQNSHTQNLQHSGKKEDKIEVHWEEVKVERELEENIADTEDEDFCLKSLKSVPNLNVYVEKNLNTNLDSVNISETDTEIEEETDEEEEEDEDDEEEILLTEYGDENESISDQLSVIYEESERGDSCWSRRPESVISETTIIEEHKSEDEDEDFLSSQNVNSKIKMFQEKSRQYCTNNEIEEKPEKESQSDVSFTVQIRKRGASVKIQEANKLGEDNLNGANEREEMNNEKEMMRELTSTETIKIKVKDDDEELSNNINSERCKFIAEAGVNYLETKEKIDTDWWGEINVEKISNEEPEQNMTTETIEERAQQIQAQEEVQKEEIKLILQRNKETIFDNSFFESNAYNRCSIYDILKEDSKDADEIVSGGTLMKIDSFASRFDEIKRNSGLWENNDNTDDNVDEKEELPIQNKTEKITELDEEITEKEIIEGEFREKKSADALHQIENSSGEDDSDIDFWSQIKSSDDDFKPRQSRVFLENDDEETENNIAAQLIKSDSVGSMHSSCNKSPVLNDVQSQKSEERNDETETLDSNSEISGNEEMHPNEFQELEESYSNRSAALEPQTIKERIEALRKSIAEKQKAADNKGEAGTAIPKNKVGISIVEVAMESHSKTASTKSSVKSLEEYSEEEEMDSGVISDISRHISDNEEFPELRKLTRYERAATHSRLFKLLQEECEIEEEEEEDVKREEKWRGIKNEILIADSREDRFSQLSVRRNRDINKLAPSRSKLSLPLNKCTTVETAEDKNINEKLVDELIQSLLRSKKAQMFRGLPKEKLHAAAVKILKEGIESTDTPSEEYSSLLSPTKGISTQSSTPAQTPQEFYGDSSEYKQYYESWNEAASTNATKEEILPSKTFKFLQEQLSINKMANVEANILAKCPRVQSRVLDKSSSSSSTITSHSSSLTLSFPSQSNDVTNT